MKLKESVEFKELEKFGFIEDPANCEVGDTYYQENNYYYEFNGSYGAEFRLVVNLYDREIKLLALSKERGLIELYNLNIFKELIENNLIAA